MRSAFMHSLHYDLGPTLEIIGAVMFGAWTLAYAQILYYGFRHKTYGLPMACIFLNISWEFLFAFNIIAPLDYAISWGNRLWFAADLIIVSQVFLYGRQEQTHPWVRKHFYEICVAGLLASGFGMYFFAIYFNDVYGVATSFLINLLLSLLFIPFLFSRPDLRGLPHAAAWWKFVGSVSGALFCYIWWPRKFEDGVIKALPNIHEPPNSELLYFLYVSIAVVDLLYIYLYMQQRKALRAQRAA